jgi:TetR/AcrR family transcriptional regulator of autoinduction and epiphytic fitness
MSEPVKHRRYDAPRRRQQAQQTRGAVLDAARALFVERGFAATTIAVVADRAQVSPETVYAVFGTKREILAQLLDVAIAGDRESAPVLDQSWVDEMRREPEPRRRLFILARHGAEILERRAAIDEVVRGAAAADPEVAELWRRGKAERFAGQRELLRIAADGSALASETRLDHGAAVLYAIGSPETYLALVVDRGWAPARFADWYADTLERLLLGS